MLEELRVRELGVIADLQLLPGPTLTAITGETGAGKTLVVEALELALGGRGDTRLVRGGATEASVEARFSVGDDDVILTRVIPADGRSRAYRNAQMVPLSSLEEHGRDLVDLYGQHAHQSLLRASAQRNALDVFAGVDLSEVRDLRREIAAIEAQFESLGGDERSRARELDRLHFELEEIEALAPIAEDEDERLRQEESILGNAATLREVAFFAYERLEGDEAQSALVQLESAITQLSHHDALGAHLGRLDSIALDLRDAASELRAAMESFEGDPDRLAYVSERRAQLTRLVRKHGESLAELIGATTEIRARIEELESSEERRVELMNARDRLSQSLQRAEEHVGDTRRKAAPALSQAVEAHFSSLALARARFFVEVPETGIGDEIEFTFGANPGEPAAALSKVASGGELARVMLALRLVLSNAPDSLVFDEVDAGIGGEVALAVGKALRHLADEHQVLVVTHLAQVAAYADVQFVVEKHEERGRTITTLRRVDGEDRLAELSRMLSGFPNSVSGREHAAELLAAARENPRR